MFVDTPKARADASVRTNMVTNQHHWPCFHLASKLRIRDGVAAIALHRAGASLLHAFTCCSRCLGVVNPFVLGDVG